MMSAIQAIVTAPPYAPFLEDVAKHRMVCGLRFNTVMPLTESREAVLERLAGLGCPLWVDLKGRQLRVTEAAVPPYTEVRLSHRIVVKTPVDVYFSGGRERARAVAVDGNRLILGDGPHRLVGPGESVNIVDPSLQIEGGLTDTDRAYLAAMKSLGQRNVMLSYVHGSEDIDAVREVLPDAEVMVKIEDDRGLAFARKHGAALGRLMAARGDLFVEVLRPHRIAGALKTIIAADAEAVVASRLFHSLVEHPVPNCADIGDVAFLLEIGYRTFLFGDAICFDGHTVMEALNLLQALAAELT